MSQTTINLLLGLLVALMPVITIAVQKLLSRNKDKGDYSSDLLQIANDATDALRKAREEITATQDTYEKTVDAMRNEHNATITAIRTDYDGRHQRLKTRIEELEKVQKIYAIQFDLVTHPNVEIRNIQARAMDDAAASQKMKAIQPILPPDDQPKTP